MKDFYRVRETNRPYEDKEDYLKMKKDVVIQTIKPICDAFEITNYDYDIENGHERLIVEGQAIGCVCNSIGATVMELINYIWLNTYADNRTFCFQKQVENALKKYWIEE